MKKFEFFKVEGNKINRLRRHCLKCGPAVFLAEHKDRFSCGKCGYTEYKSGGRPAQPPKIKEKPIKSPVEPPVVKKTPEEKTPTEETTTAESSQS